LVSKEVPADTAKWVTGHAPATVREKFYLRRDIKGIAAAIETLPAV
jgi:hypothetical protein